MEPLIYYPTFEPPSESWLKFSLLYIENFRPIIPNNRHNNLSDNYIRIINETDLINPLNPSYDLGHRASLNAIEEVEKIYNDVHQRSYLFNNSNLIRKWENPQN